jgi:hypothetical protein
MTFFPSVLYQTIKPRASNEISIATLQIDRDSNYKVELKGCYLFTFIC